MNICSKYHDEIVFEGRQCPLCDVISELDEIKETLEKLREENEQGA